MNIKGVFTVLLSLAGLSVGAQTKTGTTMPAYANGIWVSMDYLNTLRETRSPKAASKKVEFAAFYFAEKLAPNKMNVGGFLNFHEGFVFYASPDSKDPNALQVDMSKEGGQIGYNKLEYSTGAGEVMKFSNTVTHADPTTFVKLQGDDPIVAVEQKTRELCLVGSYATEDLKTMVTFTEAGKITGWDKHKTYQLDIDVVNSEIDILHLDEQLYTYEIKGDKMLIYELIRPEDPNPDKGKLKYTLVLPPGTK